MQKTARVVVAAWNCCAKVLCVLPQKAAASVAQLTTNCLFPLDLKALVYPLQNQHWLDPYDFLLDLERIAQHPAAKRDASRLMLLRRGQAAIQHTIFRQIPQLLPPKSLVVANDAQVEPRRLVGHLASGGRAECLLLERQQDGSWRALVRNARRLKAGLRLMFAQGNMCATALSPAPKGGWFLRFDDAANLPQNLQRYGLAPLPPYIRRNVREAPCPPSSPALHTNLKNAVSKCAPPNEDALASGRLADREAYQTCYAKTPGAVAAPTAGLHFTPQIIAQIEAVGSQWRTLTLHVGEGTFAPVLAKTAQGHRMHQEWVHISAELAQEILEAKAREQPIIAVGTTTVRALETWGKEGASPHGYEGWSNLFMQPGFVFSVIDGMVTNFHLPRSTLLLLVCAFHGTERTLRVYHEAMAQNYRFYSFGDCMLILPTL